MHAGWKNPSMNVTAQVYIVVLVGSKTQFLIFMVSKLKPEVRTLPLASRQPFQGQWA